jgi:small subunit ribosomal protein S9
MAENTKTKKSVNFFYAVGRRKQASARARLYQDSKLPELKKGDILVNGRNIEEYFPGEINKVNYNEPFKATDTEGKFIFTIKVAGGGVRSQLGAVVLAISKTLVKADEKNKQILRKKGFLTTDARVIERRKVGTGGKARRKKQSPKR